MSGPIAAPSTTTWETIVGMETHVQLDTRTKMYCGCQNAFGDDPNTHVCPICLGWPGSLPVVNAEAVRLGIKIALALGCTVNQTSQFSRKNYFYPDLPKGYQISQYEYPIGEYGALTIRLSDGTTKSIRIRRVHLEEDTAKLLHLDTGETLLDHNRAGVPLMEIVTMPDLRSPEEAEAYLRELQGILRNLGASQANMEEGHLRCEPNISLLDTWTGRISDEEMMSRKLNKKREVKNLNSISQVKAAIENIREREIERIYSILHKEDKETLLESKDRVEELTNLAEQYPLVVASHIATLWDSLRQEPLIDPAAIALLDPLAKSMELAPELGHLIHLALDILTATYELPNRPTRWRGSGGLTWILGRFVYVRQGTPASIVSERVTAIRSLLELGTPETDALFLESIRLSIGDSETKLQLHAYFGREEDELDELAQYFELAVESLTVERFSMKGEVAVILLDYRWLPDEVPPDRWIEVVSTLVSKFVDEERITKAFEELERMRVPEAIVEKFRTEVLAKFTSSAKDDLLKLLGKGTRRLPTTEAEMKAYEEEMRSLGERIVTQDSWITDAELLQVLSTKYLMGVQSLIGCLAIADRNLKFWPAIREQAFRDYEFVPVAARYIAYRNLAFKEEGTGQPIVVPPDFSKSENKCKQRLCLLTYLYGGPTEDNLQLILQYLLNLNAPVEDLSNFNIPSWRAHVAPENFASWFADVISMLLIRKDDYRLALGLITSMIHFFPQMPRLGNVASQLAFGSVARHQTLRNLSYDWSRVALFALDGNERVALDVLLDGEDLYMIELNDFLHEVYNRICLQEPDLVMDVILSKFSDPNRAMMLSFGMGGWGLTSIPCRAFASRVRSFPQASVGDLARLVADKIPLGRNARFMLQAFPKDKEVMGSIYAELSGGIISGSMSEHYSYLKSQTEEWQRTESSEAVRRFAAYAASNFSKLVAGYKRNDETLGYDEKKKEAFVMRVKESASDYRYFPEPDLPLLVIPPEQIELLRSTLEKSPLALKSELMTEYGLDYYTADLLVERSAAQFFRDTLALGADSREASVWITGETYRLMNVLGVELAALSITPEHLASLITAISSGKISKTQGKEVWEAAIREGGSIDAIIKARGLEQVSDTSALVPMTDKVFKESAALVGEYFAGKEALLGAFVGKTMKVSSGKANPTLLPDLIKIRLSQINQEYQLLTELTQLDRVLQAIERVNRAPGSFEEVKRMLREHDAVSQAFREQDALKKTLREQDLVNIQEQDLLKKVFREQDVLEKVFREQDLLKNALGEQDVLNEAPREQDDPDAPRGEAD